MVDKALFFTKYDNFEKIIKDNLKSDKVYITKISTGWTNFVFLAKINNKKSFIFRFPRNEFFAQTLIKEKIFCKYIKKHISFKVPDIKLCHYNCRPYTIHKYMKGKTLTECYDLLKESEKTVLCKDIAKFIHQIQNLKPAKICLSSLSKFLEGLSKVGNEKYNLNQHKVLINLEKEKLVLCHADFNPGNILINKKNRMFAVLDFAFVSYSSNIVDISRILGRLPDDYYKIMIEAYEKKFNIVLNQNNIKSVIKLWHYVEEKYISYMLKNHTDVVLPIIRPV